MTRPKVPPDQRQRTAQACESCKRRKQKCNGLCPCNTCEKRKFTCIYLDRDTGSPGHVAGPPAKKVLLNDGSDLAATPPSAAPETVKSVQEQDAKIPHPHPSPRPPPSEKAGSLPEAAQHGARNPNMPPPSTSDAAPGQNAPSHGPSRPKASFDNSSSAADMSRTTTQSGPEEEAVVYIHPRMLQDPTGRLLYVGDSATLSFLQLIRMMVESVAGPSPFTTDPQRHRIVESQFTLPSEARLSLTHLLPDKDTALVLVHAFFINTQGLIHVFDRPKFLQSLDACYSDPLEVEPTWLCHLNLVCAIGLMLATPRPNTAEYSVVERLRTRHPDRAEVFYFNAKSLHDPLTGFEDADFWSVQALLLMSFYMLSKSRRNTAFALIGMAVRSGYALGLHKEETVAIFAEKEQNTRRNVWRSLFVMDRIISCQLGRPTAISEEECSGDALRPQYPSCDTDTSGLNPACPIVGDIDSTSVVALDAAVRSCSAIGIILKKVYQHRKISTRLAQEIADICKMWSKALAPMLHWMRASTASIPQGIAILHVNLMYCHSIVLLTRPFFLFILSKETQKQQNQDPATYRRASRNPPSRMEKFSEACVVASTHTVLLVQNAFDAGYLPRRNPAVIYFLFAATLVILSNEFAGLYSYSTADQCISNAIHLMSYCAETEPQASRLVYIMTAYRSVVLQQRERWQQAMRRPTTNIISPMHHRKFAAEPFPSTNTMGTPGPSQPSYPQNQSPMDIRLSPIATPSQLQQQSTTPRDATHRPHMSQPLQFSTPPSIPSHLASTFSPEAAGGHYSVGPLSNPTLTPTTLAAQPLATNSPANTVASNSNQNPNATQSHANTPTASAAVPFNTNSPLPASFMLPNALDPNVLDSLPLLTHDESSGGEEQIDFDALWAWPVTTPAAGTPRFSGDAQAGEVSMFTGMDP